MGAPTRGVSGEKARVAWRIRSVPRPVARAARQHAPRLGMASRARRRAGRRGRDPLRARKRTVVTSAAGVRIGGIEHGDPARRAERAPVERARPWIGDRGIVHTVTEIGRAGRDPLRDGGALRVRQKADMRARIESRENRRRCARGKSSRGAGRLDARYRRSVRRCIPTGRRCRPAMTRRAVRLQNGGDVGVEDGSLLGRRAILRARREQRCACKEARCHTRTHRYGRA